MKLCIFVWLTLLVYLSHIPHILNAAWHNTLLFRVCILPNPTWNFLFKFLKAQKEWWCLWLLLKARRLQTSMPAVSQFDTVIINVVVCSCSLTDVLLDTVTLCIATAIDIYREKMSGRVWKCWEMGSLIGFAQEAVWSYGVPLKQAIIPEHHRALESATQK